MRKILFTLCGTMVLVLLALSPAYAQPFYQSDLVCLPLFEDRGYTVIQRPSGDLFVFLRTDEPPGRNVMCQITCDNLGVLPPGPVPCGKTDRTGTVKFIVPGLGNVSLCENPSVQVFNATIDCTSGYSTPRLW